LQLRRTQDHVKPLLTLAAYAWASPNTLLGLLAGLAVLALGGRVRVVRGVAEFSGGLLASWVAGAVRFNAITFGHVILGVSEAALTAARPTSMCMSGSTKRGVRSSCSPTRVEPLAARSGDVASTATTSSKGKRSQRMRARA
jgi:hypothetical protein